MNTTIFGLDPTTAIVIAVTLVAVAVIVAALTYRHRKSGVLKSRFGPEYARAVAKKGGVGHAEAELKKREQRVAGFDIHPLAASEKDHFVESWGWLQSKFVDNPKDAVARADDLFGQVMAARGYPMAEFEQSSADLSVNHPAVVENYRAAHEIAGRQARGAASTEDLRQAMVHYRSLFDELVASEPAIAAA